MLSTLFLDSCDWPRNRPVGELLNALSTRGGALKRLEVFDMHISGELPFGFFEECSQLETLGLGKLGLTGVLPASIGRLASAQSIILHCNHLSGCIPSELCECRKLKKLLLFENDLTGPVPSELEQCELLEDMRLTPGNKLDDMPRWARELASRARESQAQRDSS